MHGWIVPRIEDFRPRIEREVSSLLGINVRIGSITAQTVGLVPWFDHPQRATRGTPIVFGHWSTEGLVMRDDAIGLDTGCVWGGQLTALRLEDRALFQVDCPQSQPPGD